MSERDRESSSVPGDEERPTPAEERVTYSMSPGLSGFLGTQRIALAVSSYQSGKFYLLGQNVDGGLLVEGEPAAIASDARVRAVYLGESRDG